MGDGPFEGRLSRYVEDAQPWWPPPSRAPAGAPNVVLVVLDDVGFAQLGCFGSDIDTPTLDRLAAGGLRYTNFHTTSLCSPTRACLLTGRNHHANGMGRIIELATGFPGYDARIPKANGFLSEILVGAGYAAWAVGKWHLTPVEDCHLGASRARWPLGRGFERFYGFFSGETHQFVPALLCDNHQIQPPGRWEDGYHLTTDLVDQAMGLVDDLRAVDEDKPFFLYLATGACHSPHQAPPSWIGRYAGHFDSGWDAWREATLARQVAAGVLPSGTELSPRPDWVPAWSSLTDDERRLYGRYMEAFAGFLSHTDHELGRLVDFLDARGELDDTVFVVLSDNGASSEGGPTGSVNDMRVWNGAPRTVEEGLERIDQLGGPWCHNNYPWGWTVAGNTPFKRWKREVHEGGVADPLIVHWPARITPTARGDGFRRQYVHAVDFLPTVLDIAGVEAPPTIGGVEQRQIDGVSFARSLVEPGAEDQHTTQYYEMFGCRALYHEGWKAVTWHPIADTSTPLADDAWELYHVAVDPSECHDLAAAEPERLESMIERWWEEAEANQVLPLDCSPFGELFLGRHPSIPDRRRYVYRPHRPAVPEEVAVNVRNRSHAVTASVEVGRRADGAPPEGIVIAQGSGLGGWALLLRDGCLQYVHNLSTYRMHRITSEVEVVPGAHVVGYRFTRTAEHRGTGQLLLDGEVVGDGEIRRFTPLRFSLTGAGLTCGYSDGLPVDPALPAPFAFTGTIHEVVVEVDGEPHVDPRAEAELGITTQ
jgi:arylsulfatase A-like enzyme